MTQGNKDGLKAITGKMRDNANDPIPADIIHDCDLIDEIVDNTPTTEE